MSDSVSVAPAASRVELRFINPFWFTLSRESSVQEHGIQKELDSADTLWEGSLASYMLNTCKSELITQGGRTRKGEKSGALSEGRHSSERDTDALLVSGKESMNL